MGYIPFWPRRMDARMAAAYCGYIDAYGEPIVHAFKERVKAGMYPEGQRDGRSNYWLRDDLDTAIEISMGKVASSPGRTSWGERLDASEDPPR